VLQDITHRLTAERELRETRDYLENLLGYANAPIIVWDQDLRVTRFNHAFEALTGMAARDVVGRRLELLFPADERRAQALAHVTSASAGERWQVVEIPIQRADGDVRTVLWNSATVYDADGVTPVATIAQGQDITERVAVEAALRESEDKFRYVFDRSIIAMSLTLPGGRLRVNDAFCHMLGYARDELEQLTWQEVSHPDDVAETELRVAELTSGVVDSVRFVKRYLRKSGAVVWGDVSTSLRRGDDGEPLYFMTAVVDITEQRRAAEELRASEARLRSVLDSTPFPVALIDTDDDVIRLWSRSAFDLFGHTAPSAAEWYVLAYPDSLYRRQVVARWEPRVEEARRTGRTVNAGEYRVTCSDGSTRDCELYATFLEGELLVTFRDVTERRRADEARRAAESKLTELNAELEQRVRQRTAELDAVNSELEAFAYSVSHDLRAPLRHVSGFSQLLARYEGDRLDDKGRHYLETILAAVGQMGVLIDDLLQFSRTGRAELTIADVDMAQALEEALQPLRSETRDRDVEWTIGALPHVTGDHALLRQVWANLLGNAVKYTRGRAPARIEVGVLDGPADDAADDAQEVVFFVRDNGVGFDMAFAHKLFGVFQRLHTSDEFEGTGIGLANVQRIISRLGGRVWAQAEPGRGATFCFSLPARKEMGP